MFGGHCFLPHEWRFDSASPKVVWRPKGHDFDSATRGLICWQFTHVVVWLVVSNMFIFHHIWDNPSHNPSHRWLKHVKTTNQLFLTYAKPSFRTPPTHLGQSQLTRSSWSLGRHGPLPLVWRRGVGCHGEITGAASVSVSSNAGQGAAWRWHYTGISSRVFLMRFILGYLINPDS